jgi:hypothetical protein
MCNIITNRQPGQQKDNTINPVVNNEFFMLLWLITGTKTLTPALKAVKSWENSCMSYGEI